MPSFERYVEESREDDDPIIIPDWTRLPFPQSWEEFERGVDRWLDVVWGPDWRCPHCGNRFWMVLEPVGLNGVPAWPGKNGQSLGYYPTVPVACARCTQLTPVLLGRIFEPSTSPEPSDE
jgi:hypothetical protein